MIATVTALTLSALAAPTTPAGDAAHWYADYDEAVAAAKEQGKDLLVDFTGSDWCGWCIKLDEEVFSQESWWKAAQRQYVLVALDFPRGEKAKAMVPDPQRNVELRDQHGIRGYPTVLLMTPEGDVFGRTGYKKGGPDGYLDHMAALRMESPPQYGTLEVGSTVPAGLTLPDLDGKRHSFGDFRGRVVMIHFWSDRCPYEKHADPIFAAMDAKYRDSDDVVMIGINANSTELGEQPGKGADHAKLYGNLREKMAEVGYTHPMLADHGNRVADVFEAQSTPHCFVLDRNGVIQYAGALDDDPRGQKDDDATNFAQDAIDAVLKGETPATASTKPYGCSITRVATKGGA
ncbi:MAG: thioredoxin family protein [Planctomycetota bacterium]